MAIMFADARNLLELRRGQNGGKVVTLGRLNIFFHNSDLKKLRSIVWEDHAAKAWIQTYRWGDFAESFFRDVLKLDTVESIDISAYQGASIIHDLGEPLSQRYIGKFDLAVDGGTLEHVFNFPVAIANLMKLVRVDGTVYMSGPCNNLCGHGFYQFSPELMYRLFSAANGFEPIFVRVAKARYPSVELTSGHAIYDVKDPDILGERVSLVSATPIHIMVMARRIVDVEPFRTKVLQSDYIAKWDGKVPSPKSQAVQWLRTAASWVLPVRVKNHILGLNQLRKASLTYRRNFRRVW